MRQFLFFLSLLFASLLICCLMPSFVENEMSDSKLAINRVIQKTIEDVNHLNIGYPLSLVGTGGSIDHATGKERTIKISLRIFHPLSKEACRWLVVEIAKLFLININSSSDLTPFLPDGHFTYQNLDVGIGVLSPNRLFLYHPDITFVAFRKGEISYATNDPQYIDTYGPYKEVIYEPIEEAFKIVESQGRPDELKNKSR